MPVPVPGRVPAPAEAGDGGDEVDGVVDPEVELLHVKSQSSEPQCTEEQKTPGHLPLHDSGKVDPAFGMHVLVCVSHVCAAAQPHSHQAITAIDVRDAAMRRLTTQVMNAARLLSSTRERNTARGLP